MFRRLTVEEADALERRMLIEMAARYRGGLKKKNKEEEEQDAQKDHPARGHAQHEP